MILFLVLIFVAMVSPISVQASDSSLKSTAVAIPGGEGGIGFDDLVFSSELHKVLVPAGHTGKLYLIDPISFAMTSIGGFSSSAEFQKGHEVGISSVGEGEDLIFAADHGKHELVAIVPEAVVPKFGAVMATDPLAGDADYVRYVGYVGESIWENDPGGLSEIWVTEPHNKQIEVFKLVGFHMLGPQTKPKMAWQLKSVDLIHVPTGPESLVIDYLHRRAYTNLGTQAAAIDLKSHLIVSTWPNGCQKSRGDALDEKMGFLFVSCGEGKVVVFDLNHDNKKLSQIATDPGPDVISYNPKLSHLYITSSKNATLSVLGVSAQGQLSLLGQAQADIKSHCVVSDDQNNIWVCDPPRGQLLRYKDLL